MTQPQDRSQERRGRVCCEPAGKSEEQQERLREARRILEEERLENASKPQEPERC